MNGNPRGIRRETLSVMAPPDILGLDEDGCKDGRLLWVGVSGIQGSDAGGPAIPNHLQRGGGCAGTALGCSDGGDRGQEERARTRGQTPKYPLLCR